MFNFKKEHLPRIAYWEQRNGVRLYYVEKWSCYPDGCMYSQDSEVTTSLKQAEQYLKEISDKEIVKSGTL